MTLRKLFRNPRFHKLTIEQRLLACALVVYGKNGQGTADPQHLQNKPLLSGIGGIEDALVAVERALPIRFFTKNGKRFYEWER